MKKILLFSTCLMCLLMDAQDYTQERREVKDGKRTEAKASWWGFDKNNATKCLQDAINSGVKRLIVDNTGRDWILDRIGTGVQPGNHTGKKCAAGSPQRRIPKSKRGFFFHQFRRRTSYHPSRRTGCRNHNAQKRLSEQDALQTFRMASYA